MMKMLYNRFLIMIENLITLLQVNKMKVAENIALVRKRKLINDVQWDNTIKSSFDSFWVKSYGKKIKSNGHKLYEAINGIHQKDYIPDFIFATKIEPFFNSYFYAKLYSDKSLTEILYGKKIEGVIIPKTYMVNCSGVFYNHNREVISKEEARAILKSLTEAVIKPTIEEFWF